MELLYEMYCAPNEHNSLHIHVYYQDDKAIIDINKVELTEGKLPRNKLRLVLAWIELRKEELPFKIDPLR